MGDLDEIFFREGRVETSSITPVVAPYGNGLSDSTQCLQDSGRRNIAGVEDQIDTFQGLEESWIQRRRTVGYVGIGHESDTACVWTG